jgi:shikimate kinase
MDNRIFLIGYRAVGKTTVGRELARAEGLDFFDTDQIICQKRDSSIAAIVREEGWEGFRRMEREVLQDLAGRGSCVVATGGGAILHRDIWDMLKFRSLIVWLSASDEVLVDRFRQDAGSDENRPSLTGEGACVEFLDVLRQREPLYRATAHVEIDTGLLDVPGIVHRIQQEYAREKRRG